MVHGIASPSERAVLGKPAAGKIDIRCTSGDLRLVFAVEDDGRGLDAEGLARIASQQRHTPSGNLADGIFTSKGDLRALVPQVRAALRLVHMRAFVHKKE